MSTSTSSFQQFTAASGDASSASVGSSPSVPSSPSGHADASGTMKPTHVLKHFANNLTLYEHGEILQFPQIYYFGQRSKKKIHASTSLPNNCGYDDDNGDYRMYLNDHILYRYEVVEVLGKGSFGQCVRVLDHKQNTYCALKIIRNKKRFHKQGLVEVKLLEFIRDNDPEDSMNNVRMYDYFYFRNHLCLTFELLSINLYEFMKETNFHPMSPSLVRRFTIQILNSLRFLHHHKIIHCDLKPENILLKTPTKSGIKVIDFGSSCFVNERIYSYIQSRFYRAPEVIMGVPYDCGIDMWSLGCIMAELLMGYPIFPGEDEVEQMSCIMEIIGVPPHSVIDKSTRKKHFFDSQNKPRIVPNSQGKKRRPGAKDLRSVLRCPDMSFVSFVEGCLRWDPKARFTPDQAIQHPWISGVSSHRSSSLALHTLVFSHILTLSVLFLFL
jgi:serine/threonine protein kinase